MSSPAGIPAAASSAGFNVNTFSSNANFSNSTVDTAATYAKGFQWYPWNFFNATPDPVGITPNPNGSISLLADGTNENNICSAAQQVVAPFFVGKAFGGGGYFETIVSFNPNGMANSQIWPAVWAMTLEHLFSLVEGGASSQWQGQAAGYAHFLEVDTFEFDRSNTTQYGSTLHDWYGIFGTTCGPGGFCNASSGFGPGTVTPPVGTDFNQQHKLGMLWIPATASVNGSYTFYFDDIVVAGPFSYSQFTNQTPPPTSQPWLFGIGDQQHLVMILGGGLNPFTITKVNVWQATTNNNMIN